MSNELDRRNFVRRAVGTGATVGLALTGRNVLGANDRIRVGVVGTGRQGTSNLKAFKAHGAEIAAVADVFEPNLKKGLEAAGGQAKAYSDFRRILDDKDIDVVVNATPDHWHALPVVLACQAGKDVFVEKPASLSIDEGNKMVAAARKAKRVVQVALWQRSNLHFARATQIVQDGFIGKVTFVRTWNYGNSFPDGIGNPPDSPVPPGLDWDMWLGPAPKVPFNANRFGVGDRWSTFRYFYDYANGWVGDWAVHLIDIVHWAMKVDGPQAASASGAKLALVDNAETPDTLQLTLEYPGFLLTYENRQANANSMWGHGYGIEFHGTEGTLFVDRSGFQLYPESGQKGDKRVDLAPEMKMVAVDDGLFNHVGNMLECMRTRALPACDIEIGARTSAACILGNIALRTHQRVVFDPTRQVLVNASAEAQKLFAREYRSPWKLPI